MTQRVLHVIEPGQTWKGPSGQERFVIAVHTTLPMGNSTVKFAVDGIPRTITRSSFLFWVKKVGAICL